MLAAPTDTTCGGGGENGIGGGTQTPICHRGRRAAYNKVWRKQYLQPVCHAPNIIIAPLSLLFPIPLDIRLAMAAAGGMRPNKEGGGGGHRTTRDETRRTNNSLIARSLACSFFDASLAHYCCLLCPSPAIAATVHMRMQRMLPSGCSWTLEARGFPGASSGREQPIK